MRWVLTHLIRIETVSKLLDCGRKSRKITFISIHINANHDDKSILECLTRALCPQLLRNLRTRRRFDSSSIIAHPVNFDKDR